MSARVVIVAANIGRDAETRKVGDYSVTEFPIAVNEKRKNEERTSWFRCKVWNRYGEALQADLVKGARVSVEGRISVEDWEDRDGNKRTTVNIDCDSVHVEKRNEPDGVDYHEPRRSDGYQQQPAYDDPEIPF